MEERRHDTFVAPFLFAKGSGRGFGNKSGPRGL